MQSLHALQPPLRTTLHGEGFAPVRSWQGNSFSQPRPRLILKARAGGSDLHLVEQREEVDGSTLFVFGSASEAEAAKKQRSKSKPAAASSSAQGNGKSDAKPAAPPSNAASETGKAAEAQSADSRSPSPAQQSPSAPPSEGSELDFAALKVNELKELCKARQITGFSKLNKAELIEVLKSSDAG